MKRTHKAARPVCALSLALTTACAFGQGYPNQTIRIMVPIEPGSAPDIAARVLGEKLSQSLGQTVVVENRSGANGNIAGAMVVKAAPDGYTLFLCPDSLVVINPHLYRHMGFDPMKDLAPIASVAANQFFLLVNPDEPFKTLPEFIDYARKAAPPLHYASGGNGSQQHLTMEMLKMRTGIDLVHVPYKSSGPATIATMSGEVPVQFAGSTAGPLVKSGKLRALAVSGKTRMRAFPDIPTLGEFYPGLANSIWLGLYAPNGTPKPVIDRLHAEINKALAAPDVKEKLFQAGGLETLITTPEEFSRMMRAGYEKYGDLVKRLGVRID